MNVATSGRDPFMPRPPKGRGPALALALVAHGLLIVALAFSVHWRSSQAPTLAAELWSAVPQAAAPRAVEAPPPTATAAATKPPPVVEPTKPVVAPKVRTPALPDAQIAVEKAKREAVKLENAERERIEHQKQQAKQAQAQKKAMADKLKADKEKAESAKKEKGEKAEAARLALAREANLKRMQGLAGAAGGPTATGAAVRSSGPSASYAGRIMARIKPNIVFGDSVAGNPLATVEVTLGPDGSIVAKRLIKSSGVRAWDEAVLRAIERTEVLPRDIDGRVPPPFQIDFRPRE